VPSVRAFLQTKVARRVFGLFLVCAVAPTATLAASGYWLIAREYQSQARLQLAQASKVSAALILARLQAADVELAQVARASEAGKGFSLGRLRGVSLARPGRVHQTLKGDSVAQLPPLPVRIRAHLESGRAALVSVQSGGATRLLLVRAAAAKGSLLWGELSLDELWGASDDPLSPPGVGLCVFGGLLPEPLYCSPGATTVNSSLIPGGQGQRHAVLETTGQRLMAETSSIFLGFEYSAEPWTVVLEQPLVSTVATHSLQHTLLLTCLLGISLVVFASNVLLRQRLDPVARLQEGTRRIAAGDFGASVQVSTGDEFQELAGSFNAMASDLRRQFELLNEMTWGTLEALARTIDANSPWTAGHSERVTRLAIAIGRRMDLSEAELERLHRGGLLHDVGKISIPRSILDKPAPLTTEEMALVREHPVVGARILEPIHAFGNVLDIVRHHHEWFDGRGYPDRLAGVGIPFLARVVAVADVYDALVSSRPYRSGWSVQQAKALIARRSGEQFDPAVVRSFLVLAESEEWWSATSAVSTALVRQPGQGPDSSRLLETFS
jgi:putative nucleotidyltransferase with HDIG domain